MPSTDRHNKAGPIVKGALRDREQQWLDNFRLRHPLVQEQTCNLIILVHRQDEGRSYASHLPGECHP